MFWKLFGSEERVQRALDESTGYDISPNVLPRHDAHPAAPQPESLTLWKDFAFKMPANTETGPHAEWEDSLRAHKKA